MQQWRKKKVRLFPSFFSLLLCVYGKERGALTEMAEGGGWGGGSKRDGGWKKPLFAAHKPELKERKIVNIFFKMRLLLTYK